MNEYFNEDQNAYWSYINSLPRNEVCPCGWYRKEECLSGRGAPSCNTEEGRRLQYERLRKDSSGSEK